MKQFSNELPPGFSRLRFRDWGVEEAVGHGTATHLQDALSAANTLSESRDPEASMAYLRDLRPKIDAIRTTDLPKEIAVSGVEGNRAWTQLANLFKEDGWSTTLIASDDLTLAQGGFTARSCVSSVPAIESVARGRFPERGISPTCSSSMPRGLTSGQGRLDDSGAEKHIRET